MNVKACAFVALVLFSWIGQAHEFWLEPKSFRVKPGESVLISFKTGENFMGKPWTFAPGSIERAEWNQLRKSQDIRKMIVAGEGENLAIAPAEEGSCLLVVETKAAVSKHDGEQFNEYLREYGLDEPLLHRKEQELLADSARELCSRHSKLLVQAGDRTDETFKKQIGLPIEIVPAQNPYSRKIGDRMIFTILYLGKPLFGARVKVFNRHNNRTTIQNIYTQQDGTIETTVSSPGSWLISVVKMIPSRDASTEWRSYWGTLSFGI
jgi:uncharacterized GH25 family protein